MLKVRYYDLKTIYEEEIVKNVKSKKRIASFEKKKVLYLFSIKRELESGTYEGSKFNIFIIKEPKVRLIMSQNLYDKTLNHYFTRYILEPKLSKYLCNNNVATRKNMGLSYGIELLLKFIEQNKKYENFYFLKIDIKKYFFNIDHEVLKKLVVSVLDKDEYELFVKIISSTNREYINREIAKYSKYDLPFYKIGKGLPIGLQSSQFLAIFYLHRLHHYIIHNLHIKHIVIYMDDYILIHHDKEYLKYALKLIEDKLYNEYELELNKNKTEIKSSKEGIIFLGYRFRIIGKKTIVTLSSASKKKIRKSIKKTKYMFLNGKIDFESVFSSINTIKYGKKYINRKYIDETLEKLWYN